MSQIHRLKPCKDLIHLQEDDNQARNKIRGKSTFTKGTWVKLGKAEVKMPLGFV